MEPFRMERQHLAECLKGQEMHVPDLESIFEGWPCAFNPEMEHLRNDVDDRLISIVEKQYKNKSEQELALKKLRAPSYALLGAYWWPFVDDRTLHTMTYLAMWIALWDDVFEVEAPTYDAGALAKDWEQAQKYRYETLLYVRQALRLPTSSYQKDPETIFITSFKDIADHVNEVCDVPQKERLFQRIEQHVLGTAERQKLRMVPEVPTIEDYLDARMASSGVRVCATLLEICQDEGIAPEIRKDPNIQTLLDQINIIILVTNDMCSLKSKLTRGNVDNLLALLWLAHGNIDSAISVAKSVLETARNEFDRTAAQLMADHCEDAKSRADVENLVSASQAVCTGNLVWSFSTRRYDIHLDPEDNSRTIIL